MTDIAAISALQEGDIYRWRWADQAKDADCGPYRSYHCCSKLAVVRNGKLVDTFWYGSDNKILDPAEVDLTLLGNVANLIEIRSYDIPYYRHADIVDMRPGPRQGHRTRAIPPAISRALKVRDQGCRFPGCTQSRYVDGHHIQHWCDGGETSLDNLITLCRFHHRLLHQEVYEIVKGAGGEFAFVGPSGEKIPRALPQQFEDAEDTGLMPVIERQHAASGLAIDARTAQSLWEGEPCDYGMAVEALMAMEARPAT